MIISVNRLGEHGIFRDVAAHSLPINAWSDGKNVRFINGAVEKIDGDIIQFGATTVAPYFVMPVPTPTDGLFFWLYAGTAKVYVVDQASLHTNLTRAAGDYAATVTNRWNGGILSGVPVINNGVDVPQMWLPMSTAQPLQALSNWPATYRCRTIRPWKRFLIAHDITKAGIRYPRLTKWSHPVSDPGTVPSTWDETDQTKDAGEFEWAETGDAVVDSIPMRDQLLVYKEDSTWAMQYIGGVNIFRFSAVFDSLGILNVDWALRVSRGEHVVFTGDDLVIHNGVDVVSVLEDRWQRWLRDNLHQTHFKRSFLVLNRLYKEIWLCFPSLTSTGLPDRAIVWNMRTKSLTLRELTNFSHGAYSINRDLAQRRLLMADPGNSRLKYMDETNQFNLVNMTSYVERQGIGIPLKVNEPPDLTSEKFVRRIFPRITGTVGGVVKVYLAMTNTAGEAPTYGAAKDYTIGTTKWVDFQKTGTLMNIKLESTTDIEWAAHGYEVDFDLAGKKTH